MKKRIAIMLCLLVFILSSTVLSIQADTYNHASSWAVAELAYADQNGLIPEFMKAGDFWFSNEINRIDFCKAVVMFYDKLGGSNELSQENPFDDVEDALVTKAYQAGIIKGKSGTQFKPLDSLTRQEMCVMIVRALKSIGTTSYATKTGYQKAYVDLHAVASWASEEVESMNAYAIMNGSDSNLDPTGHLTSEQAIIMMYRAYAAFSDKTTSEEDHFTIENGVLTKCVGIGDIVIPNTVTAIAADVFYDFAGMTSVTIPGSVQTIPEAAFRYCPDLETVVIENGVAGIEDWAFAECEKLVHVTLPLSLKQMGKGAFNNCSMLGGVSFNEGLESIGETAFRGSALTAVTLPKSLVSIGDEAFYVCEQLAAVTFQNDATVIGDDAFEECHEDLRFECNAGSTAESYANDYGYGFVD